MEKSVSINLIICHIESLIASPALIIKNVMILLALTFLILGMTESAELPAGEC